MAKSRDAALKTVSLWEYEPEAHMFVQPGVRVLKGVSEIDEASSRHRAAAEQVASDTIEFYGGPDAIDISFTPRAMVVLAVLGALDQTTWVTVGDIQIEIENRKAPLIPMATLYPLIERLAALGMLNKKQERGSPGRPKSLFRISHLGCRALALGKSVADSWREDKSRSKKK